MQYPTQVHKYIMWPQIILSIIGCVLSLCSATPPETTGPLQGWNSSIAINASDLIAACSSIADNHVSESDELPSREKYNWDERNVSQYLEGFEIMELPDVDATTIARVAVKYFADVPTTVENNDSPPPSMEDDPTVDDSVRPNAIAAPLKEEILLCAPNIELAMKSVEVTEACRKEIDASVEYIVEMDVVFTCTSSVSTVPGQRYAVTMVSLISIPDGEPLSVEKVFIAN